MTRQTMPCQCVGAVSLLIHGLLSYAPVSLKGVQRLVFKCQEQSHLESLYSYHLSQRLMAQTCHSPSAAQ